MLERDIHICLKYLKSLSYIESPSNICVINKGVQDHPQREVRVR